MTVGTGQGIEQVQLVAEYVAILVGCSFCVLVGIKHFRRDKIGTSDTILIGLAIILMALPVVNLINMKFVGANIEIRKGVSPVQIPSSFAPSGEALRASSHIAVNNHLHLVDSRDLGDQILLFQKELKRKAVDAHMVEVESVDNNIYQVIIALESENDAHQRLEYFCELPSGHAILMRISVNSARREAISWESLVMDDLPKLLSPEVEISACDSSTQVD